MAVVQRQRLSPGAQRRGWPLFREGQSISLPGRNLVEFSTSEELRFEVSVPRSGGNLWKELVNSGV